ncbi:MAG: hypothetical protein AAFW73_19025 [Bacteroidota bacterium]
MSLFVDNHNRKNKFEALKTTYAPLGFVGVNELKATPYGVARKIAKRARTDCCCIYINADLQLRDAQIGDLMGLSVVEELRSRADFLAFVNPAQLLPIVLYSTFSEDMVRRQVGCARLLEMPGILYRRCVHPQQLLAAPRIPPVVPSAEAYRPYFSQGSRDIGDEVHRLTNLYAFNQCLAELYRLRGEPEVYALWEAVQHLGHEPLRNECFLHNLDRANRPREVDRELLRERLDVLQAHFLNIAPQRQLVLIDDQAKQMAPGLAVGWRDLYHWLWYRGRGNVVALDEQMKDKHLLQRLQKKGAALILDYYLHASDRQEDLADTRAAEILRAVKQWNPTFPVAIATASDKAWSWQQFDQLGCDTYWIKPGTRSRPGQKTALEGLLDFGWQLRLLTGAEYNFFRRSERLLDRLLQAPTWWEKRRWDSATAALQKGEVVASIRRGLRELQQHYLESLGQNPGWVFQPLGQKPAAVVGATMLLIQWIEKIHGSPRRNVPMFRRRQDFLGVALYQMRNKGAHNQAPRLQTFNLDWIVSLVKGLIGYLHFEPELINQQCPIPPRLHERGKIDVPEYYLSTSSPISQLFADH